MEEYIRVERKRRKKMKVTGKRPEKEKYKKHTHTHEHKKKSSCFFLGKLSRKGRAAISFYHCC